jgi:hypothetical protein
MPTRIPSLNKINLFNEGGGRETRGKPPKNEFVQFVQFVQLAPPEGAGINASGETLVEEIEQIEQNIFSLYIKHLAKPQLRFCSTPPPFCSTPPPPSATPSWSRPSPLRMLTAANANPRAAVAKAK